MKEVDENGNCLHKFKTWWLQYVADFVTLTTISCWHCDFKSVKLNEIPIEEFPFVTNFYKENKHLLNNDGIRKR